MDTHFCSNRHEFFDVSIESPKNLQFFYSTEQAKWSLLSLEMEKKSVTSSYFPGKKEKITWQRNEILINMFRSASKLCNFCLGHPLVTKNVSSQIIQKLKILDIMVLAYKQF
jgi:hypothetical protein